MSQNTKGPWLHRPKCDGVYGPPPHGTQYTYGDSLFGFNPDRAPSDADLSLILAAPDLLDALEAVPADADFACASDFRAALERWWSSVAAPAIAKAKKAQP